VRGLVAMEAGFSDQGARASGNPGMERHVAHAKKQSRTSVHVV